MSTGASTTLDTIYSPIREEMGQLARFLENEFEDTDPFLFELLQHISKFRGKQIRPALLFLLNRFAGAKPSADAVKIGAVIEMVHTATLVHDDLLDGADMRRRVETVHTRWGDRPAILIGDFIYSRAFQLSTEVQGMAPILSETTNLICEGELLQIGHRNEPALSEEIYFEIIRKKTAILHAVACQIGGLLAGRDRELCDRLYGFGLDLGMAFQIIDDCLDYAGNESVVGKSLGTDLHQGKVTLPLIYLREQLESRDRDWLFEALRRPLAPDEEERIHSWVRDCGALADAHARAVGFVERAKKVIDEIAPEYCVEPAVRESLELAAEYVLKRQK